MKIPFRWLRELVETGASPTEAAERLTMAGIEVAGVTPVVTGLTGVLVGEIASVAPHPAGGPLTVCRVSTGVERFGVVCGAPNVRAGARAAFAPPGAVLPGGRRIEAATIKGVVSQGMLCSEAELGIGEDASTILLLGEEAPVGADLVAHLGLDDVVLEVEVTPNRPDCLSVLGIAREVAALTRGRLTPPPDDVPEHEPAAAALAAARIDDAELCARFSARVVTDVTVGPSPAWLAQRLRAAGLRPINNVVDVTNYVMWELGHPLHAFDHALLREHRIVVRRARAGEALVTLDGQTRSLADTVLVIADAERAVSVAGVMGGANSEVGPGTRTVLLEAAYFKPASIRRTARALGLSTEASYRFERGADIEAPPRTLARAARLVAQLAGGRVARGVVDVYPAPRPRLELTLRPDRIRRVLGVCPPKPLVGEILQHLGFPVREEDGAFAIVVPSFRRDVSLEDDLVEEIARVWGYGEIPSTLPSGTLALTRRPRSVVAQDAVRRALTAAGYQEAVTISLLDPARLAHLGLAPDDPRIVTLQNPLASDRSVLRPTLLFGLLEALQTNVRRQAPDVRLFEVGRVFQAQGAGKLALEETRVGIALTGLRAPRTWFSGKGRADVFDAKGAVETVVETLGRGEGSVEALDAGSAPYLEEGRGAMVVVQGSPVGVVGELHPAVQRAFDLPGPVFFAELSLDRLEALPPRPVVHRPLPRFPAVQRDLAVVVPATVPSAEVSGAIRTIPNPHLKRVTLFDVYTGGQVGSGRKSLAYSLLYQAEDRTLTDAEVNAMHREVVERIRQALGAEVRGADWAGGAGGPE
ncbi:MAG: phenylalanine--tRNA ligase subunit beta [Candidatus Rokubacteria bacterium]|nr:phenylalanine--tRNA ligase subunit beta [Candidatus Rokubacteria bacterium]